MTTKAPDRIWIDWKRANDGFLAYDERPGEPFSDCQDGYVSADLHAAVVAERDALREALNVIDALDPEEYVCSCHDDALRGLVLRMGEIARAALAKQEPTDE